jgi:glucokinase
MAGEAGHIRLEEDGPWGFGKKGSFEGFCSGGGIAQLGKMVAEKSNGNTTFGKENIDDITARDIAAAAFEGDAAAKQIFTEVGFYMGRAVAILIDIINPEMIIIGSIYQRCRELIEPRMRDVLEKEALEASLKVCRIVPSSLGEKLGDFAAVAVAKYNYKKDV